VSPLLRTMMNLCVRTITNRPIPNSMTFLAIHITP